MRTRCTFLLALGILTGLLAAACHKDPTSSNEPEVFNVRDNFHFRISDVNNHDTSLFYYWRTGGTSANIDQSSSIQGGRVSVLITDSSQVQTYQTDLRQNGSFITGYGDTGWWRISISLENFSGMIDFRVQRR